MSTTNPATAGASTSKVEAKTDLAALLDEPAARAWYRRPVLWGGVLLLVPAAAGLWWWQARQTAGTAPNYTTQAAVRGNLTLTVTANGTLQPTRSINIGSELSGTVSKVNVDVNDRVSKGQVLVELDTAKLRDQILRSRAALAAAVAKVAQTVATVKEARANLDRLEDVARLSGGKVPSKAELDSGRATLDRAIADEASARAGVNDARAALSTDETNLSKASIRAPADGVVLTRNVDPGNAVAASLQAVTLFIVAEDLAKLRLWVYVDEADVGSVATGQDATFTVSAYPSRHFPARVTRVGFGSTITDNVVTYLTYLDVACAGRACPPRPGRWSWSAWTPTREPAQDNVDKEGRAVPASLPRADFFHWLMVDIAPTLQEIKAGACSDGITARGKRDPQGPAGSRQGLNDYTGWFAGDPEPRLRP